MRSGRTGMLTPGLAPYGAGIATTEQLLPNLYLLTTGGWQVYLWHDETGVTLIDAGAAGSGPELRATLTDLNLATMDVDRLVRTHFHDDHTGGAAEITDRVTSRYWPRPRCVDHPW